MDRTKKTNKIKHPLKPNFHKKKELDDKVNQKQNDGQGISKRIENRPIKDKRNTLQIIQTRGKHKLIVGRQETQRRNKKLIILLISIGLQKIKIRWKCQGNTGCQIIKVKERQSWCTSKRKNIRVIQETAGGRVYPFHYHVGPQTRMQNA